MADFDICPKRYLHKHVLRDCPPEPPSEALLEGRRVHEAIASYLAGRPDAPEPASKLPTRFRGTSPDQGEVLVERKLAIDGHGRPVSWQGSYYRGTIDFAIVKPPVALLVDWKTGKRRENPAELEFHALLISCHWPGVETVSAQYAWLRDECFGQEFRIPVKRLLEQHRKKVEAMQASTFEARPGPLCGWCPVKVCSHNKT